MQLKQLFISDTIHDTILLSDCEKEIISTKLFNRLHHISQNSTAYLTFPTNRTKRFEHSIGTMKLCGDIFYNAICNSDKIVIEELLNLIDRFIQEKIIPVILQKNDLYRPILGDNKFKNNGSALKKLTDYKIKNIFYNRFIPNHLLSEQVLLYTVTFQAIRLCGLLHDIGHPPFSHITEHSINKIYKKLKGKASLTPRETTFKNILEKYDDNSPTFQLHEKMGLKMTEKLLNDIITSFADNDLIFEEKWFRILAFELAKSILNDEKDLATIHTIISGSIDGDRLDYVNRDIQNSGINNGKVEYDRLISSCKFMKVKFNEYKKIEVVFNAKTISNIESFFHKRWFLYQHIILHHRVSKTDTLFQDSVEDIILDYLKSPDNDIPIENGILPDDISGLWRAIEFSYSNTEYFESLIQWDDNWLITVLKKHYFKDYYEKQTPTSYKLEEFLSNKKNYYSIVKNNNDFHIFSNSFEKNINQRKLNKEPYKRIAKKVDNNSKNRILQIVLAYDRTYLDTSLNIEEYLRKFIDQNYKEKIKDWFIVFKKIKSGLDPEPRIYREEEVHNLTDFSNIRYILDIESSNYPFFYVYIMNHDSTTLTDRDRKDFLTKFGKFLAESVSKILN